MNNISLADIHCDTAYELYRHSQSFYGASLAVCAEKTSRYQKYLQVAAIFSDNNLDNNAAYEQFFKIADHFKKDILGCSDSAIFDVDPVVDAKNVFILSVEDARILDGKIDRLERLYNEGTRILTPLWRGETCIGGSFDTISGLTDFGKEVISKSVGLGIVPDISHASLKSADDIFDICLGRCPVIASHSSSYTIFEHPRNLTDSQFRSVCDSGGLVGVNLYTDALGLDPSSYGIPTILTHIEHYLSLGGEDCVCFGCDFDGAPTPRDIPDISYMYLFADEMLRLNYSESLVKKIFYENVNNFVVKNIMK